MGTQTLGLNEDLMGVFVGKTHDLIFDRRAVAWANPLDDPGIHGAAMQVLPNDLMGFFIGMRDETGHLTRVLLYLAQVGKYRQWIITLLPLKYVEIDGPAIDARRSPGL